MSLASIINKALEGRTRERSEVKKGSNRATAKKPQNISIEQRDQIIRFLKANAATFPGSRKDLMRDAIDKFAPGKLSVGSATYYRWASYIGDKRYDPDLRDAPTTPAPAPASAPGAPVTYEVPTTRLGSVAEMLNRFPRIIETCAKTGTGPALTAHPEWRQLLLGRGENKEYLYQAVTAWRRGVRPKGEPKAEQAKGVDVIWTKEQELLVQHILNDPHWRTGHQKKLVSWEAAFAAHPEWGQVLLYGKVPRSKFLSFVSRVRHKPIASHSQVPALRPTEHIHAEPMNGAIQISGREYTLNELEEIVKAHQNAIHPVKHCPECGYSVVMHNKCYAIAIRHSQVD